MLYIIPTIDTEGVHGPDPFDNMILGNIDNTGKKYGIELLCEIFQSHNVSATFFLDIYEISLWGKNKFSTLCDFLNQKKFDVQLHTHPGWREDPSDNIELRNFKKNNSFLSSEKDLMTKLKLEEQIKIIDKGISILEEILKKKIIAHRSGGYSINEDTIKALQANNLLIDSSMNLSHKNSTINWSKNAPISRNGLLEIPVTNLIYKSKFPIPYLYEFKKIMKTDIDTCNLKELIFYVNFMRKKGGNSIMNLFMHSYSLLKFDKKYTKFSHDKKVEDLLRKFLAYVEKLDDVQVVNIDQFYDIYKKNKDTAKWINEIPEYYCTLKILKLAFLKIRNSIFNYT